ncbi:MAG: putative glutamine amidotransferase [Thermoleophilaceae bacterium]|nr:putative glutamine amidotransferase [Thermoleophilaceae bacterium]
MSGRPLVGLTTSEVRIAEKVEQTPEGEPPQVEMTVGIKYVSAIEAAGGVPVVIPPLGGEAIEPLLDSVCGVCMSGGPDIDPSGYGERPHAKLGPTEATLDHFELAVARAADRRNLPILGICRGAQALNVARGGTLHQHLPDVWGSAVDHRQRAPGDQATHAVRAANSSRLAAVLGEVRVRVNSFHHQAVALLGTGLRAVAWAPDGVVEAIEAPDRDFVVGVQWHAECLADRDDQAALFRGFVEAAGRHAARAAEPAEPAEPAEAA